MKLWENIWKILNLLTKVNFDVIWDGCNVRGSRDSFEWCSTVAYIFNEQSTHSVFSICQMQRLVKPSIGSHTKRNLFFRLVLPAQSTETCAHINIIHAHVRTFAAPTSASLLSHSVTYFRTAHSLAYRWTHQKHWWRLTISVSSLVRRRFFFHATRVSLNHYFRCNSFSFREQFFPMWMRFVCKNILKIRET